MLTNRIECVIIYERQGDAGVAQLVEQLICNQQVGGSNPSTSSRLKEGCSKDSPYIWESSRAVKWGRL